MKTLPQEWLNAAFVNNPKEVRMTTLLINVRDDTKVQDVVSFLRMIDFLEVCIPDAPLKQKTRRHPAPELLKTRIVGNIMEPVAPDSVWEVLSEVDS